MTVGSLATGPLAATGSRRRPWRRPTVWLAAGGVAGVALGFHLGWFAGPLAWQQATGWAQLPRPPQPVGTVPLAAGEPPLRLRWLGHAGFLLEWRGARILVDPNLSARCTIAPRRFPAPMAPAGLGTIDAALVSHAHFDHLDLATLRGIPRLAAVVVPAGSEEYLATLDPAVRRVGLRPDESLRVGDVEVVAVPAAHNGNRLHPLGGPHGAVGYVLRAGASAVYVAGDTGRRNDFAAISRAYRPQAAILPIGAFRPRVPLARYHLSPEEAVEVARELRVRTVVPAHFGTFVLSLDAPDEALPRFAAAADRAGLSWVVPQLAGGAP